jgi:acyl carrier protein
VRMDANTLNKVFDILSRYAPRSALTAYPPDELRLDALGLSSAEQINIVIEVEDAFDLDVEDDSIAKLRTIGDLVRAVEASRGDRGSDG